MALEFDPAKDIANLAQHGLSLARAGDIEIVARLADDRFDEHRFRAYGFIDGRPCCLVYTIRGSNIRAISLRRARLGEVEAHRAPDDDGE